MDRTLRSALTFSALAAAFLLAAREVRAQAPYGWIQQNQWLLLGPMGNPAGCDPGTAVSDNWIAPEDIASVAPIDGDPAVIDFGQAASESWQGIGNSPTWYCIQNLNLADDDLVNFEAICPALSGVAGKAIPVTSVCAVLLTYVTNLTPAPVPAYVCTSSDDSIQVWVNDQKVQEVRSCRTRGDICAENAPALLLPGTNAVKVLLWQGTGAWSFRLRLSRIDWGPITSSDGDFEFGCPKPGDVPAEAFRIARKFPATVRECAAPGGALDVVIDGNSVAGPDVTVTERLAFSVPGAVAVEGITAGGVYTPSGFPAPDPVGIFEKALDVGSPCYQGATVDNGDGSYSVTGGGADIWVDGDQFQFAYKVARGDFDMIAHVADRQWVPGSRWGKVGIMARESLAGKSRYGMIQIHGADLQDQDRFAGRTTHLGSDNFEQTSLLAGEHRDWLRLERVGSLITGYFSLDGTSWDYAGSMDWGTDAPSAVLLGLAVCSRGICEPATITFDQIAILGGDQNQDPVLSDEGAIVWSGVPRSTVDAGLSYRLRGKSRVDFHGDDGAHAVEGLGSTALQGEVSGAGIFTAAHDIGGPCAPGSTVFEPGSGRYTVTGGGNDIWIGPDQFQFAYSQVTGDFSLRAHFVQRDWAPGVRWGKGGIMARETCAVDSRYFFFHDSPDPDSARLAIQRTSDVSSNFEFGIGGHPDWIRIDRIGDLFAAYASDDGVTWTLRYREAWIAPVPATVLIGFALTSNENCLPSVLVFDQVSLSALDYFVTREVGGETSGCPVPGSGNSAKVVLDGSGPPGANVLVSEEVRGQVEVKSISNGGVFTPFSKPVYDPVGIWDDARDVGEPCTPGSTTDNGDGSYSVAGSGTDIWLIGDQFQFAYVEANGDFVFIAHMADKIWDPGSRWGKVGIMARQSLDPRSRYVSVQDHGIDPQDQTRWAARPSHGGEDNYETVPLAAGVHHDWLRIERTGDLFIGSSSEDGVNWIEQGRQLWFLAPKTVLLGLHVCSHNDCGVTTIRFDNIDYQGGNGTPGSVPDGGTISWNAARTALDSGISYEVASEGNALAAFDGTADGVTILGQPSFAITQVQEIPAELAVAHDVGNPCVPGNTVYDPVAESYAVTGSGSDIWQGGDQFQFAYKPVSGDYFIAVAHIADRQWVPGSRWGKVGLMARQDCTSRSRYAMVQDHGIDPQDAGRFAARPTQGGSDNYEQWTLAAGVHRDWMRLDRNGSVFTGYFSFDGSTWERQGSVDFGETAPPEVLLGLAVCSHTGCDLATIVFDNFRVITQPNNAPTACIETDPASATVFLSGGNAEITLKGTCSSDGDGGAQGLNYLWARIGGPTGLTIENKNAEVTKVTFTKTGAYKFRLTVNDRQITNNTAAATVDVTVTDQPPEGTFRRGDANSDGAVDLSDPVNVLGFLFLGNPKELACPDAADADDTGELDITDAVYSLNWQFLGGKELPAPGPFACGPDPTSADPLTVCVDKSCQ